MIDVRCPKDKQEALLLRLDESLKSARVEDRHFCQIKFILPQLESKLTVLFNVMEGLKEDGLIDSYSVSQTTLDDVSIVLTVYYILIIIYLTSYIHM